MDTPLEKMLADKDRFIPESGFNLVGLDDFQEAGFQLYLIGHFTEKERAESEMAKRLASDPDGDRMFIYGPE